MGGREMNRHPGVVRATADEPAPPTQRHHGTDLDWRLSRKEWAVLLAALGGIAVLAWLFARWRAEPAQSASIWLAMAALQFIVVVTFAFRHARPPPGPRINTPERRRYLLFTLFGRDHRLVVPLLVVMAVVWIGWHGIEAVRWFGVQTSGLGAVLAARGLTLQASGFWLVALLAWAVIIKLTVYLLRANAGWRDALLAALLGTLAHQAGQWTLGGLSGALALTDRVVTAWLPSLLAVLAGGWLLARRARSLLGSPVGPLRGLVMMSAAVLLAWAWRAGALLIWPQLTLPWLARWLQ